MPTRTAGVMTTLMRNGRDRRLGKPVKGHAIVERALLVGTRSADHIRASGHCGCIAMEVSPPFENRSYEGGASRLGCRPSRTGRSFDVSDSRRSDTASVDYERTLVLAIEVSNKSWVLAAQVPGLPHTKAKRTIDPEAEALLAAIAGYRTRAAAMGRSIERVIAVYEAGWSGFWLARWLMRHGVEVHVVQPSSVPVDRRMRRAKSDGIDAELLLRTLLAWLRGEPRVCSMVPVPDEADEDARRCVRERTELISERVGLTNRIGAVLATLGVSVQPIASEPRSSFSRIADRSR